MPRRPDARIFVAHIPRSWLLPVCLLIAVASAAAWQFHTQRDSLSEHSDGIAAAPAGITADEFQGEEGVGSSGDEVRVVSYTVKPGDTLSSIAETFNTSVESVAYVNGILAPDRIGAGQVLSVIANASGIVVQIGVGDTLSGLSAKYGVPVDVIVEANHLDDPDSLSIGQTLVLPGVKVYGRVSRGTLRQSSLRRPVNGPITSVFGWRIHPITGTNEFHEGIDIAASEGTPVRAAAAGRVSSCGSSGGYGRLIVIDHGDGIETRYGHLSGYAVKSGEQVSAGQCIGYVGSTGLSTGPHLHFEVRVDGEALNPRDFLP